METTAAITLPPLPVHAARSEPKKPEGANPRTRRFGINPGVYNLTCSPRASGLPGRVIPANKLLMFETWDPVTSNYEGILGANKAPAQIRKEKTAAAFINNVKVRGGARGFTELTPLTPLTDDEASFAFYSVFTAITDCPMLLDDCVTCRLRLLSSLDLNELPLTATIRTEQGQIEVVTVERNVFRTLQSQLLTGYTTFRDWAAQSYATKVSEIEGRRNGEPGVSKLKAAEHYYRKQLHLQKPEDVEKEIASRIGEAQARETAKGFAGLGDKIAGVFERIVGRSDAEEAAREAQAALNQAQMETLKAIADSVKQPASVVAQPETKVDGRTKEGRALKAETDGG